MNEHVSWRVIALGVGILIALVSAGWAIDARMDRKISNQLAPMREDVREIRKSIDALVEYLLTQPRPWGQHDEP